MACNLGADAVFRGNETRDAKFKRCQMTSVADSVAGPSIAGAVDDAARATSAAPAIKGYVVRIFTKHIPVNRQSPVNSSSR